MVTSPRKHFIPLRGRSVVDHSFLVSAQCTASAKHALRDREQLDLEHQGSVWRDCAGVASLAVSKLGRDGKARLVAHAHGRYTFVPTLDHLAGAQDEGEGLIAVHRAVELGAVRQPAGVMDGDGVAVLWRWAGTRGHHFNLHAESFRHRTD